MRDTCNKEVPNGARKEGGLAVPLPQGPSFLWTTEQSNRSSTPTSSS